MHFEEIYSCDDVSQSGLNTNGIHNITVQGRSGLVPVYCDLNTDGGNWLVSYSVKAGLMINTLPYNYKRSLIVKYYNLCYF